MKNNSLRRRTIGTKASIATLAIRAGLLAGDDGQIYDEKNFDAKLAKLIADNGYAMCPKKASKKVRTWAKRKSFAAYGC